MSEIETQYAQPASLASTQWVADHLHDPNVRIVEVIWGSDGDHGLPLYEVGHIPGSIAWDYARDYGEEYGDVIGRSDFESVICKKVGSNAPTREKSGSNVILE